MCLCTEIELLAKEVFYQVDVESFKDSNGDTVGDLVGLQNQLPYFENLQIKTLCLRDNLIDETDPKKIKSKFGDESTIKNLKKQLEAKGIFYFNRVLNLNWIVKFEKNKTIFKICI